MHVDSEDTFTFLPSEICRLVLGFLKEQKTTTSHNAFLEVSPFLEDCRFQLSQNKPMPLRVVGMTLTQMLDDYAAIRDHVSKVMQKKPIHGPIIELIHNLGITKDSSISSESPQRTRPISTDKSRTLIVQPMLAHTVPVSTLTHPSKQVLMTKDVVDSNRITTVAAVGFIQSSVEGSTMKPTVRNVSFRRKIPPGHIPQYSSLSIPPEHIPEPSTMAKVPVLPESFVTMLTESHTTPTEYPLQSQKRARKRPQPRRISLPNQICALPQLTNDIEDAIAVDRLLGSMLNEPGRVAAKITRQLYPETNKKMEEPRTLEPSVGVGLTEGGNSVTSEDDWMQMINNMVTDDDFIRSLFPGDHEKHNGDHGTLENPSASSMYTYPSTDHVIEDVDAVVSISRGNEQLSTSNNTESNVVTIISDPTALPPIVECSIVTSDSGPTSDWFHLKPLLSSFKPATATTSDKTGPDQRSNSLQQNLDLKVKKTDSSTMFDSNDVLPSSVSQDLSVDRQVITEPPEKALETGGKKAPRPTGKNQSVSSKVKKCSSKFKIKLNAATSKTKQKVKESKNMTLKKPLSEGILTTLLSELTTVKLKSNTDVICDSHSVKESEINADLNIRRSGRQRKKPTLFVDEFSNSKSAHQPPTNCVKKRRESQLKMSIKNTDNNFVFMDNHNDSSSKLLTKVDIDTVLSQQDEEILLQSRDITSTDQSASGHTNSHDSVLDSEETQAALALLAIWRTPVKTSVEHEHVSSNETSQYDGFPVKEPEKLLISSPTKSSLSVEKQPAPVTLIHPKHNISSLVTEKSDNQPLLLPFNDVKKNISPKLESTSNQALQPAKSPQHNISPLNKTEYSSDSFSIKTELKIEQKSLLENNVAKDVSISDSSQTSKASEFPSSLETILPQSRYQMSFCSTSCDNSLPYSIMSNMDQHFMSSNGIAPMNESFSSLTPFGSSLDYLSNHITRPSDFVNMANNSLETIPLSIASHPTLSSSYNNLEYFGLSQEASTKPTHFHNLSWPCITPQKSHSPHHSQQCAPLDTPPSISSLEPNDLPSSGPAALQTKKDDRTVHNTKPLISNRPPAYRQLSFGSFIVNSSKKSRRPQMSQSASMAKEAALTRWSSAPKPQPLVSTCRPVNSQLEVSMSSSQSHDNPFLEVLHQLPLRTPTKQGTTAQSPITVDVHQASPQVLRMENISTQVRRQLETETEPLLAFLEATDRLNNHQVDLDYSPPIPAEIPDSSLDQQAVDVVEFPLVTNTSSIATGSWVAAEQQSTSNADGYPHALDVSERSLDLSDNSNSTLDYSQASKLPNPLMLTSLVSHPKPEHSTSTIQSKRRKRSFAIDISSVLSAVRRKHLPNSDEPKQMN